MAVVEALGAKVVLRGDPVETRVTPGRSEFQAGIEQCGAHAAIAGSGVDEEVVHHEDAISEERVVTGVQRGETQQAPLGFSDELRPSIRIPVERIEERVHFRFARKWPVVEGEVPLDQLDERQAIFESGRTNNHRASLASH